MTELTTELVTQAVELITAKLRIQCLENQIKMLEQDCEIHKTQAEYWRQRCIFEQIHRKNTDPYGFGSIFI